MDPCHLFKGDYIIITILTVFVQIDSRGFLKNVIECTSPAFIEQD